MRQNRRFFLLLLGEHSPVGTVCRAAMAAEKEERARLQSYISEGIVPARSMGFEVVECGTERVVLAAPLALNVNDKQMAFAGRSAPLASHTCTLDLGRQPCTPLGYTAAARSSCSRRKGSCTALPASYLQRLSHNLQCPTHSGNRRLSHSAPYQRQGLVRVRLCSSGSHRPRAVSCVPGTFVALTVNQRQHK